MLGKRWLGVIAPNLSDVFLKAHFVVGSFDLCSIGCMYCMLVGKFPVVVPETYWAYKKYNKIMSGI